MVVQGGGRREREYRSRELFEKRKLEAEMCVYMGQKKIMEIFLQNDMQASFKTSLFSYATSQALSRALKAVWRYFYQPGIHHRELWLV